MGDRAAQRGLDARQAPVQAHRRVVEYSRSASKASCSVAACATTSCSVLAE